jgi:hypothetical protein
VAGFAACVSSGPGFFTQGGSHGGLNARSKAVVPNAWSALRRPRTAQTTACRQARLPGGLHRLRHSRAQVRRRVVGAEARAKVPMSTTVKRTCDQSSDALGFRPSRYCASHLRQKPQSAAETYSSSTVESRRASCAGAAVQNMSSTLAMTEAAEAG